MTPICLDVKGAAAALSVCTKTIRQWIDDGQLPVVKLPSVKHPGERGKRILILVDDLKAFAEKHREAAP
jgi:predicted site-specific integrase-resolvase